MKSEYVHKAIDGIVISVEDRHLPQGKYIVNARIRDDKGKIWYCTLWDELAVAFMSKGLLNERAYLDGSAKEENSIAVRFFDGIKKAEAPVHKTRSAEEFEPYEELKDTGGDQIKVIWTDERGVRTYQYKHKREFVRVNGRWEKKMDYCLRVMGPSSVMEYLREFDGVAKGKLISPSKYNEKMKFMLEMCQDHTQDNLEYWSDENGNERREEQSVGASASF